MYTTTTNKCDKCGETKGHANHVGMGIVKGPNYDRATDSSNKALAPIAKVIPRSKRPKAEDAKKERPDTDRLTKNCRECGAPMTKTDYGSRCHACRADMKPITSKTKDASPFDRDTDAGAAKIVKREAKAGLSAKQIAKKHGFSLSFVEEEMPGTVKPVGDA